MRITGTSITAAGLVAALCGLLCAFLAAAPFSGLVTFAGAPVPGALVTATQGDKSLKAMSGPDGVYSFADLAEGDWNLQVEMQGFAGQKKTVTVTATANRQDFELEAMPIDSYTAAAKAPPPPPPPVLATRPAAPAAARTAAASSGRGAAGGNAAAPAAAGNAAAAFGSVDLGNSATDALAVNGSVLNGASSQYGQAQAFGNNRPGGRRMYTGTFALTENNSALDALQFSPTGQKEARPDTNQLTASLLVGGPLYIPHLDTLRNAPTFTVQYTTTRNDVESIQYGIMPTAAERSGNLSAITTPVIDPQTGQPFPGNMIPASRISPQAEALLSLYPLPNASIGTYNYEAALLNVTHTDAVNSRVNKAVTRKDSLNWQSYISDTRTASPTLFNFLDESASLGLNETVAWMHRFTPRQSGTWTFNFSRQRSNAIPFFSNRENVSGNAGIAGNNQAPLYWGPPALSFSSGISGLSDSSAAHNRNQTGAFSYSGYWNRGNHNLTYGTDFRRLEFNVLAQNNADGTFGFLTPTAVTHDDFGDFLLGTADTAALATGNADKYFRQSQYDLFLTDDFRFLSTLTVNFGLRWEYNAPVTELYGRLVNLDIAPGFTAVAPVLGYSPTGGLTGTSYPSSLVMPDKHGLAPRIGIAWRPLPASSMLIRAGFGMAYNTSVYQSLATQMAAQSPLAKSLSLANSAATPLTLANGFNATPSSTPDTFALDPNFRIGYVENWNVSLQRDLPAAMQMVATYSGIKGTRAMQEFAPNTYAPGGANPCPSCPAGFVYVTSNGNSTYESGKLQLLRRFRSGFSANTTYTYAHSLDDASALGGGGFSTGNIAQNWRDLDGQRGPSSFDQRHNLAFNMQYSTGVGGRGGALLNGWKGHLYKGWTIVTTINAGSGMPVNPVYPGDLPGTTFAALRPDYTGVSVSPVTAGMFLNPAAFSAPAAGQFGSAGRDSLRGPNVFTLNASMQRSFQLRDRMNLNFQLNATNPLNQILITGYNASYGSALFGMPTTYSAPRNVVSTVRLNF